MAGILLVPVPRHQLACGHGGRAKRRDRDGHQPDIAPALRHGPHLLPDLVRHDGHPRHRGEHELRGLPTAGLVHGERRLPATPAQGQGLPSRPQQRHPHADGRGGAADRCVPRQDERAHPALRAGRVHVVHAVAGRHGASTGSATRTTRAGSVSAVVNTVGAITTGIVFAVIAITKFSAGRVDRRGLVPIMVAYFLWVKRRYDMVRAELALPDDELVDLNWQAYNRLHNHVDRSWSRASTAASSARCSTPRRCAPISVEAIFVDVSGEQGRGVPQARGTRPGWASSSPSSSRRIAR